MVTIKKNDNSIIWTINLSGVKKETYILPEDVKGIVLADGSVDYTLVSGQKFDFVGKKYKHCTSVEIILSSSQPIELKWGVFDIPYKDYESKLSAKCGLSGTLSLRIFNTKTAFKGLGKNVVDVDVKNAVFNKLKMDIEEVFSELINEDTFGRPDISGAKKTRFIESIKNKDYDYLSTFGLELLDVTLNKLIVDEEYDAKRRVFDEDKEKKQKVKSDLKLSEEIRDFYGDNNDSQPGVKEVIRCPRCHNEVPPTAKHCPNCGLKLG